MEISAKYRCGWGKTMKISIQLHTMNGFPTNAKWRRCVRWNLLSVEVKTNEWGLTCTPREWAKSNCEYNDPKRISSCHFHSFAIHSNSNDAEGNSSVNGWWWWCQMKRRGRQRQRHRHRQWTEQTRINETTWYQYAWLIMKMEKNDWNKTSVIIRWFVEMR